MTREEFLEEIKTLQANTTHGLIFRTEENELGIIPTLWKAVNSIRGYTTREKALDFYKQEVQQINEGQDIKIELARLIKTKCNCTYNQIFEYLDSFITSLSDKPENKKTLKITWEE